MVFFVALLSRLGKELLLSWDDLRSLARYCVAAWERDEFLAL